MIDRADHTKWVELPDKKVIKGRGNIRGCKKKGCFHSKSVNRHFETAACLCLSEDILMPDTPSHIIKGKISGKMRKNVNKGYFDARHTFSQSRLHMGNITPHLIFNGYTSFKFFQWYTSFNFFKWYTSFNFKFIFLFFLLDALKVDRSPSSTF